MYSGTTLRNSSGRLIGAHQKLDRVSRRALATLDIGDNDFPSAKEVLHFEGRNGPDGIKIKSPARDEPWHYYDPEDPKDEGIIKLIDQHSKNLTAALKKGEREKAAFEAAWLAHALVDGLTPAHHFPLHKHLEELRGEGLETRTTTKDKLIVRGAGDSAAAVLVKNWQYWGAGGVMNKHGMFEWGVATIIAPLRLRSGYPNATDCHEVMKDGIVKIFKEYVKQIHSLKMYDRFMTKGWTNRMARETRTILAPMLVRIVALAWYEAYMRAQSDAA
jgi:hypothetical protein